MNLEESHKRLDKKLKVLIRSREEIEKYIYWNS